ncbi:RNA-directed DNA polymerase [Pedobacter gandavensis]|uniref:RNA-directed DNA polymerase n=1 Tax=Pedobacter gandavensis TaxID=2679963 RepID=UPI00292F8E78|nr:RNA-directed DNA polymerase [Pedobacter gandavensis]
MNLTLNDLIIAYKKAKSEVFHEKLQVSILGFQRYERQLIKNLSELLAKLNDEDINFVSTGDFNEDTSYYPIIKRIHFKEAKSEDENVYYSNFKSKWENKKQRIGNLDFRIISNLNVNFHIISSLWIDKVAYLFETQLSPNSYGSRLNTINESFNSPSNHFKTYIHDYRKWQKNGLDTIKSKLDQSKDIIAVTADIKSFYHHIDITFLSSNKFFEQFLRGSILSSSQKHLNSLLIKAIKYWSEKTYANLSIATAKDFEKQKHVGIPIGLAASKVIANLVLKEFDDSIEQELVPLYYGRYVDDIFLVLNSNPRITNRNSFWNFLSDRIKKLVKDPEGSENYQFKMNYAAKTTILFNRDKERFFFLDKDCGMSIVNEIEKELNENSSEWRLLPDSDHDLDKFSDEILHASSDVTENVNSLRKSDGISIQRLKFALFVRNAEESILSHPYYFWKDGIQDLFKITSHFIIDPEVLPNYLQYIVKVFRLSIYNCDFKNFKKLWKSLMESIDYLKFDVFHDQVDEIELYESYLKKTIEVAIYSGGSLLFNQTKVDTFIKNCEELTKLKYNPATVLDFFISDLHLVPLKGIFDKQQSSLLVLFKSLLNTEAIKDYIIDYKNNESFLEQPTIHEKIPSIHQIFINFIYERELVSTIPIAIFFPTRRMNYLEITRFLDNWMFKQNPLYLSFLRLYSLKELSIPFSEDGDYKHLFINNYPSKSDPVIAITSYEVADESWNAIVLGRTEPDLTRINRLYDLINGILTTKNQKIDFIVLPELSVPQFAINSISKQIKGSGITLISGVDYLINRHDSTVQNQMIYVLPITQFGQTHQVQIIQEKLVPAIHEGRDLSRIGGLKLIPQNLFKYIITINGFTFSSLICNDFLDIDNRQKLRGKIDGLFLIEWNKDIETYNSLVESTANDLHSFIIQVNNRLYGDTRIRAPFKDNYKRDVARIRGGNIDYFVVSAIQVKLLREFQMNNISPDQNFKPVPTGFKMCEKRKLK